MSAVTLTRYTINLLESVQHIETIEWRVMRRAAIGEVEIDSDLTEDEFRTVADVIRIQAGLPHPEITVTRRSHGRILVREAAFGKPILEFTPRPHGRD